MPVASIGITILGAPSRWATNLAKLAAEVWQGHALAGGLSPYAKSMLLEPGRCATASGTGHFRRAPAQEPTDTANRWSDVLVFPSKIREHRRALRRCQSVPQPAPTDLGNAAGSIHMNFGIDYAGTAWQGTLSISAPQRNPWQGNLACYLVDDWVLQGSSGLRPAFAHWEIKVSPSLSISTCTPACQCSYTCK